MSGPAEASQTGEPGLDLALVMPVYNEAGGAAATVRAWLAVLADLGLAGRLVIIDDGSTDATPAELAPLAGDPRCLVLRQANRGHGPAILRGYALAVRLAPWVFQCDSDNEIDSRHFPLLWARRHGQAAVFGVRRGRGQTVGRRVISLVSRLTVRLAFGRAVADVNTPFRLLRSAELAALLPQIPPHVFAPNVIIAAALARARCPVLNLPVPHTGRPGPPPRLRLRFLKGALRAFYQTLAYRPRLTGCGGERS
ncbi:MAG: glycosyltransferase family 2 protein [Deltaproteobacteria bacterium]|nr:glycosyltransferase family 2 protein [Deltaproteobacteria bacterium]